MPPPAKVLAVPEVREMVPVPVTVRLVEVVAFHAVLCPLIVHVPEPIAIVLIFEFVVDTPANPDAALNVTEYEFALKVPEVIVKTPASA